MSDRWKLWTDGGARGNPGPAAAGVVIEHNEETAWEVGVFLGYELTNNQAEYRALELGLEKALSLGVSQIDVCMDSQLVVEQVNGRYKVKDEGLRQRWEHVRQQLARFSSWTISYVPRKENYRADALVNLALDTQREADSLD